MPPQPRSLTFTDGNEALNDGAARVVAGIEIVGIVVVVGKPEVWPARSW